MHPLPFRNHDCSSLSCLSIASVILWMIILAMILLGIDKRVILLQLLQLLRAPFLASFPSHIDGKSDWRTSAVSSGSVLKSSALRLSCPGDFPFFSSFMAVIISCFGRLISISKSLIASVIIASSSGAGLLSTSLKSSAHLAFARLLLSEAFHFCLL